jgi:hypothetical protein
MPEAVIVSAARSPIGRAHKGSLVDLHPVFISAGVETVSRFHKGIADARGSAQGALPTFLERLS